MKSASSSTRANSSPTAISASIRAVRPAKGLTIAKVEERLRPDKTSMGLFFSEDEMHFVCPWHGMEYDMKTGECVSDRKMKLKKFKTVQKGDDLYVVA